jgi:hypothetical protein
MVDPLPSKHILNNISSQFSDRLRYFPDLPIQHTSRKIHPNRLRPNNSLDGLQRQVQPNPMRIKEQVNLASREQLGYKNISSRNDSDRLRSDFNGEFEQSRDFDSPLLLFSRRKHRYWNQLEDYDCWRSGKSYLVQMAKSVFLSSDDF